MGLWSLLSGWRKTHSRPAALRRSQREKRQAAIARRCRFEVMEERRLLDAYHLPIEGKEAVVIGRSAILGRPLAGMLLARNATVTIAHSRTKNLAEVVRRASVHEQFGVTRGTMRTLTVLR